MPAPQPVFLVQGHDLLYRGQLPSIVALGSDEPTFAQPELRAPTIAFDMDVWRLAGITCAESKGVACFSMNGRQHCSVAEAPYRGLTPWLSWPPIVTRPR